MNRVVRTAGLPTSITADGGRTQLVGATSAVALPAAHAINVSESRIADDPDLYLSCGGSGGCLSCAF